MVHRIPESKTHGIVTITQAGQGETDCTVTRGTQPLSNRPPRPPPMPGTRDQDIPSVLSTHSKPSLGDGPPSEQTRWSGARRMLRPPAHRLGPSEQSRLIQFDFAQVG